MRRALTAAVVVAAVALLLPALAVARSGGRGAGSTWIAHSWSMPDGSYRDVTFLVGSTGAALTVTAGESLPWAGKYGCTVTAGTVVWDFTLVGKDGDGNKLYNGRGLGWSASGGVCKTTELGGNVSAVLKAGSDGFQTPKLPHGPDNVLAVYSGTIAPGERPPTGADQVLYRKASASGGGSTGPAGGGGGTGADRTAPAVRALPSRGTAGGPVALRYTVFDASGVTSERISIYRGSTRVIRSRWSKFSKSVKGEVYSLRVQADREDAGRWRFCVESRDKAGNISKPSCATLVISKAGAKPAPTPTVEGG